MKKDLSAINKNLLYTHHKIVFRKNRKLFCPSKALGAFCPGKVLGVFQSGDNCNQDLVFEKTKNQIGFSILPELKRPSVFNKAQFVNHIMSKSHTGAGVFSSLFIESQSN